MNFDAIIFDFDGVLLESEFEGNRLLAELLTDLGHRTSVEEAIEHYVGLAGPQFIAAIEQRIGGPLPPEFHERRKEQSVRALREGVRAVVGAVEFVRSLPPDCPRPSLRRARPAGSRAISTISASPTRSATHVYSGREHVERGKPAPDLYLHAADALGVADRPRGDPRGFGDRRDRRARVGRDGDRPRRRRALLRRPCRHAARRSASSISRTASTKSRRLLGLD